MAKKLNYFENIAKEINDVYQANRRTQEMSNTSGPGTDSAATALRAKQTKQEGQLFGAILQGRRYDNKTGKQVQAKKK
jgi:hypothetical protein